MKGKFANRNMRRDHRTKRTVSHNFVNLPTSVASDNGDMISYTYTATGIKLSQALRAGKSGTSTRRDYAGPFVFVNNAPAWVSAPHGRFVQVNGSWENEFHLRDHLGNTRVVLMEERGGSLATLQQNHYYPFGMLNPSLSTGNTLGALKDNRYLYNGKELQDDFGLDWYDYGARMYDPILGRFHTQDRFSEKYFGLSNYQYTGNNPISNIDFKGDSIIKVTINDKTGYIKGESTLYIDHTIFDDTKAILEYAATNEVPIHLNSSFRTNKKQGGLTSANSTTPAAKSKSAHNAGLAIDFNLYKNDKISDGIDAGNSTVKKDHKFIKEVKGKSWRWGGDFSVPDKIHMDKRGTDSNFETIRDANQTQMDGDNKENVDESLIKRTEIITINKKDD